MKKSRCVLSTLVFALVFSLYGPAALSAGPAKAAADTPKSVLVPLATGFEDMEAVVVIDILRRSGAKVTVAAVGDRTVKSSTGLVVLADKTIEACAGKAFDLIALPGGMPGAKHLHDSGALKKLLTDQEKQGRLYAAICASPTEVLQPHGLLDGKRATCWPANAKHLADPSSAGQRVVRDKNCITSQGPGTAAEFAIALVEALYGPEKAAQLKKGMLIP